MIKTSKNISFALFILICVFVVPITSSAQINLGGLFGGGSSGGGGGMFGGFGGGIGSGGGSGGGGMSGGGMPGGGMSFMSQPYGGRSQKVTYCTCTPGCFKVEIGGPKGGTFMYCVWGTRLYAHYNIYPNAWQLGLGGMYINCMQIAYPKCRDDGGGPLMKINGTSQGGGSGGGFGGGMSGGFGGGGGMSGGFGGGGGGGTSGGGSS